MTADQFKDALRALWGDAWRERAPAAFDTTISTLDRWANGHAAIPGPASRLMAMLLRDEDARKTQRRYEQAYRKAKRERRKADG